VHFNQECHGPVLFICLLSQEHEIPALSYESSNRGIMAANLANLHDKSAGKLQSGLYLPHWTSSMYVIDAASPARIVGN
jgi:hypothetical protein